MIEEDPRKARLRAHHKHLLDEQERLSRELRSQKDAYVELTIDQIFSSQGLRSISAKPKPRGRPRKRSGAEESERVKDLFLLHAILKAQGKPIKRALAELVNRLSDEELNNLCHRNLSVVSRSRRVNIRNLIDNIYGQVRKRNQLIKKQNNCIKNPRGETG